jgi:hypothetical protein
MNQPITAQESYNNVNVDWSQCSQPYPIDKDAFHFYSCGMCIGKPITDKNSGSTAQYLAKKFAKHKIVKAIIKSGTFEHQLCILLAYFPIQPFAILHPALEST